MNRSIILYLLAALLLVSCGYQGKSSSPSSQDGGKNNLPAHIRLISTTPIKDQGESELSWAYAMLATIESEHIMKGDSVNLSVAYIARMMLQEKAIEYYLSQGSKPISMRGMASMLIHYIDKYGAQPYDSYEDPKDINYKTLCRKVEQLCDAAISQKSGFGKLKDDLDNLFDQEIGYMPAKQVHMLGAEYTPLEFAHSVCYPEEYVSLTSFTHHPYREYFALEIPDNRQHDSYLNLPLDEMMLHIQKAIENGHPVCWEGDISEEAYCALEAKVQEIALANPGSVVYSAREEREQNQKLMRLVNLSLSMILSVFGLFTVIAIYSALYMTILQRRRSLAIYRALGLRRRTLTLAMLLELLFYWLVAILGAFVIGLGIFHFTWHISNVPYMAAPLIRTLLIALAAGLPLNGAIVWSLQRGIYMQSVYEAMRFGE